MHEYGFEHIFLACSWEFGSLCLPLSKDIKKNLSVLEFVILACKITVQSGKSRFITRQLLHCKWRASENPIEVSGSGLCIPRNETVRPHYFQNRIIMFCLPISTFMYLCEWFIYSPRSVCLFSCSQIGIPILGIHKSLTDTWIKELGTRSQIFIFGNT